MPAPNASLVEIFDVMALIEWAALNDAALGVGMGIKKAYAGMPGKLSDKRLPCMVRWPADGSYTFNSGPYNVPIGSATVASLLDVDHNIVIGAVVAKRDNSLVDASREAARFINLVPEKVYIPNNTLRYKVLEVKLSRYSVIEMPIGGTDFIIVTWPALASTVREVISRQSDT